MTRPARDKSRGSDGFFDRELQDLPIELRWREWMGRVEAAIFASASPVQRPELQELIGVDASLDHLIQDIQAELKPRPYELLPIAGGWVLRTKARFADAIKTAADLRPEPVEFNETEKAVLCAIAYHQPIDRQGLADIFGKEVSRDALSRLRHLKLISNGPKAPRPGAPQTFVTTAEFLDLFSLQSLRDLPDLEAPR